MPTPESISKARSAISTKPPSCCSRAASRAHSHCRPTTCAWRSRRPRAWSARRRHCKAHAVSPSARTCGCSLTGVLPGAKTVTPEHLEQAAAALEPGTVAVVFLFGNQSLLSWTLSGGRVHFRQLPIERAEIERRVAALSVQLARTPLREEVVERAAVGSLRLAPRRGSRDSRGIGDRHRARRSAAARAVRLARQSTDRSVPVREGERAHRAEPRSTD